MELYNIKELKLCIAQVIHTATGTRCRHKNSFINLNVTDSEFVVLLYSGKQRFIEIGFNHSGVYRALRYIFKNLTINQLLLRTIDYVRHFKE